MILASEIIQQLNEADARRGFNFPHLSVFFPVDVRLSAYRDESSWALVIETLLFNDGPARHDCCSTVIFCYGDDLPQAIGRCGQLNVTGDGPSGPLFDPNDILGHVIAPSAKDLTIRGNIAAIPTNLSAYAEKGIKLSRPPTVQGYELLRFLSPLYRRHFFATESEIIERICKSMPLLLRLDGWRHPDRDKGEMPADSESFQMIADVLAHNDPSLYQPTEPPNTHWSNWPMAGML